MSPCSVSLSSKRQNIVQWTKAALVSGVYPRLAMSFLHHQAQFCCQHSSGQWWAGTTTGVEAAHWSLRPSSSRQHARGGPHHGGAGEASVQAGADQVDTQLLHGDCPQCPHTTSAGTTHPSSSGPWPSSASSASCSWSPSSWTPPSPPWCTSSSPSRSTAGSGQKPSPHFEFWHFCHNWRTLVAADDTTVLRLLTTVSATGRATARGRAARRWPAPWRQ